MLKENKMIYWNDSVDKETLKEFGFRDNNYFMKMVYDGISLNISKRKNVLRIDVLDEDFLQPYDYQYILSLNPQHVVARQVKNNVDEILNEAQDVGIIEGFDSAHYLYTNYSNTECYD